MQTNNPDEQDGGLPPPGNRWGAGAQSVLPYLTKSLQARPTPVQEPREPHPGETVFTHTPPPAR